LKEWWGIGYWEAAQRYYIENAFDLLDAPGEWYLNRKTGLLNCWPMPGERLEASEAVTPVLNDLVRCAGDVSRDHFVSYITLKGLTFHHADWVMDPCGNSSTHAGIGSACGRDSRRGFALCVGGL
jgi:hypothetical protein